jgi:ABC-type proline/glycine betaine transport system permease subunit
LYIINQGLWKEPWRRWALVIGATTVSMAIGRAARHRGGRIANGCSICLRPVLD